MVAGSRALRRSAFSRYDNGVMGCVPLRILELTSLLFDILDKYSLNIKLHLIRTSEVTCSVYDVGASWNGFYSLLVSFLMAS